MSTADTHQTAPAGLPEIRHDGPAFPSPGVYEGMTLRQWFAAHAPDHIPEWYRCALTEPPLVPNPRQAVAAVIGDRGLAEKFDIEAISTIANGLADDSDDYGDTSELPLDHPSSIGRAACQMIEGVRQQRETMVRENQGIRYFSWRWHYADVMVRMGGY